MLSFRPIVCILFSILFGTIGTVDGITVSLNGDDWLASNYNKSIQLLAKVPGNIYSDLLRNNVLKSDPLFGSNDLNYRWVAYDNWTFHKSFQVNDSILSKTGIFLVCHGLDTVSGIYLNGQLLTRTDNMFVRYKIDIKPYLRRGTNEISISFESAVTYAKKLHDKYIHANYIVPPESMPFVQRGELHANFIRKMQASFSWDWGPAFPTQGIWKNIEIEAFDSAIIRDIVINTIPIVNQFGKRWTLNSTIHLETTYDKPFTALIALYIYNTPIFNETRLLVPTLDGNVSTAVSVAINDSIVIHEWYPNGVGSQMLYDLKVVVKTNVEEFHKTLRIGFRTIELVEDPIKPDGLTFYFKVNGVPFYAKGSNWIPANVFPDQLTRSHARHLLESCREANMNMLRVWGGGVYEPDWFYEMADEMGIMIWHDFMFACALYPVHQQFLTTVATEITQQVRRLQHHPSIALWAGNNENEVAIAQMWWPEIFANFDIYKRDYIELYVNTIGKIVAKEDNWRPYLTSSPSNGKQTVKDGYLSSHPQDNRYGDVHFYYYGDDAWDWTIYPSTKFASEYGFQSFPSVKSLSKMVNPEDLRYPLSEAIAQRQHHTNGNNEIMRLIDRYMKLPASGGPERLDDFCYLSQIAQAMSLKTETEFYRRNRDVDKYNGFGFTMGALYWQLNDIWPAPSWASIELDGTWKMSHYFMKNTFQNQMVVMFEDNGSIKIYLVRDDYLGPLTFNVVLKVFKWSSLRPEYVHQFRTLTSDFSAKQIYDNQMSDVLSAGHCRNRSECVVSVQVENQSNNMFFSNYLFPSPLRDAIGLMKPRIRISQVSGPYNFVPDYVYRIVLETDKIALFVWLEVNLDIDPPIGHFSDNGFPMLSHNKSVNYFSKTYVDLDRLRSHIIVKSLTDVKTDQ